MAEGGQNHNDANWEREVLEKVALAAIAEQRASRRWGTAFKLLLMVYLFVVLFIGMGWIRQGEHAGTGKHTALVELRGVISADSPASAEYVRSRLTEVAEGLAQFPERGSYQKELAALGIKD